MRAWGLLVGLVGCIEPPEEGDAWGEIDGTHLLVDAPAQEFAERAVFRDAPRARLLPTGPILEDPGPVSWNTPLVVVDPTPWPRVALSLRDVQVLLYVERAALQSRVVGRGTGTGPYGHGLVELALGVEVEILDKDGPQGLTHVRAGFDDFEVEAWLPHQSVDEVWREDEISSLDTDPWEGEHRSLLAGASILDRPGGEVLLTALGTEGEPQVVVRLGEQDRSRGYLPVVLSTPSVRVEGWAHEDDLTEQLILRGGCGCGGYGYGSMGYGSFAPYATVPAGTLLHAGVDGPVVGRALQDLRVRPSAREDGATIERGSWLGRVELWVAPEDVL